MDKTIRTRYTPRKVTTLDDKTLRSLADASESRSRIIWRERVGIEPTFSPYYSRTYRGTGDGLVTPPH
jgi:hypothetical protein